MTQAAALKQLQDYADGQNVSVPTLSTYLNAGLRDANGRALVTSLNLASINSALASSAVGAKQVEAVVNVSGLITSYNNILNWANGTATDTGTRPSGEDYGRIGVILGDLVNQTNGMNLLSTAVGAKTRAGVDSVAEVQALVNTVQKVQAVVAGTNSNLTLAELQGLGLTGLTLKNLPVVISALAAQAEEGSATASLSAIQNLANKAARSQAVIEAYANNNDGNLAAFPAPSLTDYANIGLTLSDKQLTAINSALKTATVVGAGVDTVAELTGLQTIVDKMQSMAGNAASTASLSKAELAAIGIVVDDLSYTVNSSSVTTDVSSLISQAIRGQAGLELPTVQALERWVDVYERVMKLVATGVTTNTGLTLQSLKEFGLVPDQVNESIAKVLQVIVNGGEKSSGAGIKGQTFGSVADLKSAILATFGPVVTVGQVRDADNPSFDAGFTVRAGAVVKITVGNTELNDTEVGNNFDITTNGGKTTYSAKPGAFNGSEVVMVNAEFTDGSNFTGYAVATRLQAVDTTVADPTLTLAVDTGLDNDKITSNGMVNVGLELGATWQYQINSGDWISGSSNTIAITGDDGRKTVKVRQTDKAGNISGESALDFTLDTSAIAPGVVLDQDKGSNDTDKITNSGKVNISGLEDGATWQYRFSAGDSWQIGPSNNFVTLEGDGVKTLQVRQIDKAGNTSSVFDLTFTLDTEISTPTLALEFDSGEIDGITNNALVKVSNLEVGAKWEYSLDNGVTWQVGIGDSFSLPADDSYKVQVRQTDTAGNQRTTASLDLTLDTQAPELDLMELAHVMDITKAMGFTVNAGATVKVFIGSSTTALTTTELNSSFSKTSANGLDTYIALSGGQINGSQTFKVSASLQDVAGNIGTAELTSSKSLLPVSLLISPVADSDARVSGIYDEGFSVDANAVVTVKVAGTPVDVTQFFTKSTDSGKDRYIAIANKFTGNEAVVVDASLSGTNAPTLTLKSIDTTGPATALEAVADVDQISVDVFDQGFKVESDAQITVKVNGHAVDVATYFDKTTGVGGQHEYKAKANKFAGTEAVVVAARRTDDAGNQGEVRTITLKPVDTTATIPTIIEVANDLDSSKSKAFSVEEGATIEVSNGGIKLTGEQLNAQFIKTTSGGRDTYTARPGAFNTPLTIKASLKDSAGNVGELTQSTTRPVFNTPLEINAIADVNAAPGSAYDQGFQVNAGALVTVTIGGQSVVLVNYFSVQQNQNGKDVYTALAGKFNGSETVKVDASLTFSNTTVTAEQVTLKSVDTTVATPTLALDFDSGADGDGITNNVKVNVSAEVGAITVVTFAGSGGTVTKTVTGAGNTPVAVTLDGAELATLGDGSVSVSAVATDAAGNVSANASLRFTLDTTEAAAPTLALVTDSGADGDGITNNVKVNVSAEVGAITVVTFAGSGGTVTKTVTGAGNTPVAVTLDGAELATLGDGSVSVSAVATDAAGNVSANASLRFTLDTTEAAAPTLALVTDSGAAGDGITNNVKVNVSAEVGAITVVTFAGSGGTVTKTVTGAGNTPVAVTLDGAELATLGDGSVSVSAVATDAAGNVSANASLRFTLDTTEAAAPTLALVTDSGAAGDGITNNVKVNVSAEVGAITVVTFAGSGGTVTKTVTGAGNTPVAVTLDGAELATLGDGSVSVSAVATDAAGNVSANASLRFTLDTTEAAAPTLALVTDSGAAGDGITNNVKVNVSAEVGAITVVTFAGSGGTVTKTVTGAGNTPVAVTLDGAELATLGDGSVSVSAVATDAAGNVSANASLRFTLDTTEAAAPTLALVTDSGAAGDGITNNVKVNVSAEVGAITVVTFAGSGGTVTKTVTGAGNTPVAVTLDGAELATLGDGSVSVSAVATDAAGNVSANASLRFTLDTTEAAAPTLALVTDSGADGDGITNNVKVNVSAEVGAITVVTFAGSGGTVTKTVTGAGNTPVAVTLDGAELATLGDGSVSVSAVATDAAGNVSANASLRFTLDTTEAAAPTLALVTDSGADGDGITNNVKVNVSAEVGAITVVTFAGSGGTVTKTVTGAGNTPVAVTLDGAELATLGDGSVSVSAVATDAAGNVSANASLRFTLDTTEAAAPTLALVTDSGADGDGITNNVKVNVSAEVGAITVVTFAGSGGTVTKTVTGAGNTPVAVTLDGAELATLGDGSVSVSAVATDAAGNVSANASLRFTLDTTEAAAPTLALVTDSGADGDGITNNVKVNVSAEVGAITVVTFAGSGGTVTKTVTGAGNTPVAVTLDGAELATLGDGSVSVSAVATDAAGNVSANASLRFTLDTTAPVLSFSAQQAGDNIISQADNNNYSVSGTTDAAAGTIVRVWVDGNEGQLKEATVVAGTNGGANTWQVSFAPADLPRDGDNNIVQGEIFFQASVVDDAGNEGFFFSQDVTVDTVAEAPTVTSYLPAKLDLREEADGQFTVGGSAREDGTVTVRWKNANDNETISKSVEVTDGAWSIDFGVGEIPMGNVTMEVLFTDSLGNNTDQAKSFEVEVVNTTVIEGQIVAGPLTGNPGYDLVVAAYDSAGSLLGSTTVQEDGTYELSLNNPGQVVLKVYDKEPADVQTPTHRDEATGLNKPVPVMLAVVDASQKASHSVYITPLTYLAALLAGVSEASPQAPTSASIATNNAAVAKLFFNSGDLLSTAPITTVYTDGTPNSSANLYGVALHLISEHEKQKSGTTAAVLQELRSGITVNGDSANLSPAQAAQLQATVNTLANGQANSALVQLFNELYARLEVNDAPTAVSLGNTTTALAEGTSTTSRTKVADINITDDALGTNTITLSGDDAVHFELDGKALYLRAGVALDFESKAKYEVTVNVADSSVAGSSPVTANYSLSVTDVNEAPVNTAVRQVFSGDGSHVLTGLAVSDLDAENTLTIILTASNGTLNVDTDQASNAGVTPIDNDSASVTLTGTAAQINSLLLNAVRYTAGSGYETQGATLTMTSNDGALSDVDSFTIASQALYNLRDASFTLGSLTLRQGLNDSSINFSAMGAGGTRVVDTSLFGFSNTGNADISKLFIDIQGVQGFGPSLLRNSYFRRSGDDAPVRVISTIQGDAERPTENTTVTFSPLSTGQSVSVGGLTLSLTSGSMTALQVATAFASQKNEGGGGSLSGVAGASFSGALSGWSSGAVSTHSVTFTSSTASSDVANISITGTVAGATTIQGDSVRVTETSQLAFGAMLRGDVVQVSGLSFTASQDLTATLVANAFSGMNAGATTKNGIDYGTYSGTLVGFNLATVQGSETQVQATAASAHTPVADIQVGSQAYRFSLQDVVGGKIDFYYNGSQAVPRFEARVSDSTGLSLGWQSSTVSWRSSGGDGAGGQIIFGDGSGASSIETNATFGQAGFQGGGGDDSLIGTAQEDVIFADGSGGAGHASLFSATYLSAGGRGGSGNDIVMAGAGDDIIFGDGFAAGVSTLNATGAAGGYGGGGAGQEYFHTAGNTTPNTLAGIGAGEGSAMRARFTPATSPVLDRGGVNSIGMVTPTEGQNVTLARPGASVSANGDATGIGDETLVQAWLTSSVYNQVLTDVGTAASRIFSQVMGMGDDHIDAGAGNDRVMAGLGHDILIGGQGDDTLWGRGGAAYNFRALQVEGTASKAEQSVFSFTPLKAGESVMIGGLTLTALKDMTAQDAAGHFRDLNSSAAPALGVSTEKGSFSGELIQGWRSNLLTSANTNSPTLVEFIFTNAGGNPWIGNPANLAFTNRAVIDNDTFVWRTGDAGTDTIKDFQRELFNARDTLDISDLLRLYTPGKSDLAHWVNLTHGTFNNVANSSRLVIDLDGAGAGTVTQTIILEGANLSDYTLAQMVRDGMLVADGLQVTGIYAQTFDANRVLQVSGVALGHRGGKVVVNLTGAAAKTADVDAAGKWQLFYGEGELTSLQSGSTVAVTAQLTDSYGQSALTRSSSFTYTPSLLIYGDGSGGGGVSTNYRSHGGDGAGDNDTLNGGSGHDLIFGDGSGGGEGTKASSHSAAWGRAGFAGSGNDSITGGAGNDIIFGDGFSGNENTTRLNVTVLNSGAAGGYGGGGAGSTFADTNLRSIGGGVGAALQSPDLGETNHFGASGRPMPAAFSSGPNVFGGPGAGVNAQAEWAASSDPVIVNLGLYSATYQKVLTDISNTHATNGDRRVFTQVMGRGHDHINAGEGNDSVMGGFGNDTIIGGKGDDTLWGRGGANFNFMAFKVEGAAPTTAPVTTGNSEYYAFNFVPLKASEWVTVGGLTLTANENMSAEDVAKSFASVDSTSGSFVGTNTDQAIFSGAFATGWKTMPEATNIYFGSPTMMGFFSPTLANMQDLTFSGKTTPDDNDTFVWEANDAVTGAGTTATDTLRDFTAWNGTSGDKLDISALLVGYADSNLSQWVTLVTTSNNSSLTIDIDGSDGGSVRQIINLPGTNLSGHTPDSLVNAGVLIA
jgi:hypothetical protein